MTTRTDIFEGLHVLLVTEDDARAQTLAKALRDRKASVGDVKASAKDPVAQRGADLLVVDARSVDATRARVADMRSDVRARWASVATVDYAKLVLDDGAIYLSALEEAVVPLAAADKALTERAKKEESFSTKLAPLGPTRTMRALALAGPTLHVELSHQTLEASVDLSNELLVAAFAGRDAERWEAWAALARILGLTDAEVTVTRRSHPAAMNIMEPIDQALEVAAQERHSAADLIASEEQKARAKVADDGARTGNHPAMTLEAALAASGRTAEAVANPKRTLLGVAPGVPAPLPAPAPKPGQSRYAYHADGPERAKPSPSRTIMGIAPGALPALGGPPKPPPAPSPAHVEATTLPGAPANDTSAEAAAEVVDLPGRPKPKAPPEIVDLPGRPKSKPGLAPVGGGLPKPKSRPDLAPVAAAPPVPPPPPPAPAPAPTPNPFIDDEPVTAPPAASAKASFGDVPTDPAAPGLLALMAAASETPEVALSAPARSSFAADDDSEATMITDSAKLDELRGKIGDVQITTPEPMPAREAAPTRPVDSRQILMAAISEEASTLSNPPGAQPLKERLREAPNEDTMIIGRVVREVKSRVGSLMFLLVFAALIAGGMHWVDERNHERELELQRLAWEASRPKIVVASAAGEAAPAPAAALPAPSEPAAETKPAAQIEPAPAAAAPKQAEPAKPAAIAKPAEPEKPAPSEKPSEPEKTAAKPAAPEKPVEPAAAPKPADPAGENSAIDDLLRNGNKLLAAHDAAGAKAVFDQAMALDEKNPHVHEGLAEALLDLGQAKDARGVVDAAIKLRPRRARYRVLLGDVLKALGQADEAKAAYEKALEIDPNDRDAKKRLGL